jgi:hypothetical protein
VQGIGGTPKEFRTSLDRDREPAAAGEQRSRGDEDADFLLFHFSTWAKGRAWRRKRRIARLTGYGGDNKKAQPG